MHESRDFSNRYFVDFHAIQLDSYLDITNAIVTHFNLEVSTSLIQGPDEVFQDWKIGDKVVGLEWDIWFGYIVVAKSEAANDLVKEISLLIEEKFVTKNND